LAVNQNIFTPGPRLIDGSLLNKIFSAGLTIQALKMSGLLYESAADSIVAFAGGGKTSATQLTTEVNRVGTVATSGDSVKLPASAPGLTIMVINHGANPMQVYGLGTDTIDDVATATGISQMQGSVAFYVCATAGNWYAEGIGTGYAGSFQTFSSKDALTATGSNQGTALLITAMQSRFTTVAASTGAILPVAVAGMDLTIINAGANGLQVYGNGTDTINGTAGATGVTLAAGKTAQYITTVAGAWHQLLSA
jgi:hypothetical protein